MRNTFLFFASLLFFTVAFAGISTIEKDSIKLIGTTFAHNGKFAWIELNGEDVGWTKEGETFGYYRIIRIEMGKVILVSKRKKLVLKMMNDIKIEKNQ